MEKTMPHGQYTEPALTDPVIREVLTASGLDWKFGTVLRGVTSSSTSYLVGGLNLDIAYLVDGVSWSALAPDGTYREGTIRTASELLQLLSPLMQEEAVRSVTARDVGKLRQKLRKMKRRRKRRSRRRRPIQKNPQTGKVDLDASPMMFNRARDGGRRQTNYRGKKVQIRSLHKPKPLVGPWDPKNKAKFRIWNRKYEQWKKRWKAKWEGRKKQGSLFDATVRLAHSTPDLRPHLLPVLERYAQEDEGSGGGSSKRPGGMMMKFLEETGDLKVTNPDTGNKVKIKSLGKTDAQKKKLKDLFENWKGQVKKLKRKLALVEGLTRVAHESPETREQILPILEVWVD